MHRRCRCWLFALLLAAGWARPQSVAAQTEAQQRSALEKSVASEALAQLGWQAETLPQGKQIEAIAIYTLDVFDERDPVPQFVNALHVTSRDYVIRRELLFEVGETWSRQRVEETERNLRSLRQLSLANVVVARGSHADTIRLIVVTKDVWSLRLNSNIGFGGDGLQYLLLNPAEENLAGTHSSLGVLYLLDPFRHIGGVRYVQPRLGGSRYWLGLQAALIANRESGAFEGSSGQFVFELPQFSLRSPFAYGTRVAWLDEISRRTLGTTLRTFDVRLPSGETESVPWEYKTERLAADYYGTLSRGVLKKTDLSFGIEAEQRSYRRLAETGYQPSTLAAFDAEVLPVADRRIGPFLQLRTYEGRFHRVLDFELLGLQEDYRLGYDLMTRVFVASESIGSSRDLVGVVAGASYTWPLGTGLARLAAQGRGVVATLNRNEASLSLGARLVSPLTGPGRLHLDADLDWRYENYLNLPPFSLGGSGRLRGFRVNEFQGQNLMVANLEYRTRSVDILSAQVGLAAFYDVGDAPESLATLSLHHDVGMGVRILFPQADRAVLRLDYGLPLDVDVAQRSGAFYLTFGQAFALPGLSTPSVTSGVSVF